MPTRNYRFVQEILQSPGVRRKVAQVRDRKATQAAALAAAEGADVTITLSQGTRARGRPYARISLPASTEFGDSKTRRLRLLGRVVGR